MSSKCHSDAVERFQILAKQSDKWEEQGSPVKRLQNPWRARVWSCRLLPGSTNVNSVQFQGGDAGKPEFYA